MIAGCFFQANGVAWITELIFDYVYVLAGMLIWSPRDEEDEEFCSVRRKEMQRKQQTSTSQTDFFESQLQGAVGCRWPPCKWYSWKRMAFPGPRRQCVCSGRLFSNNFPSVRSSKKRYFPVMSDLSLLIFLNKLGLVCLADSRLH